MSWVQAIDFETVLVGGFYTSSDACPTMFPGGRIYRSTNGGTSFVTANMTTCFAISNLTPTPDMGWAFGTPR